MLGISEEFLSYQAVNVWQDSSFHTPVPCLSSSRNPDSVISVFSCCFFTGSPGVCGSEFEHILFAKLGGGVSPHVAPSLSGFPPDSLTAVPSLSSVPCYPDGCLRETGERPQLGHEAAPPQISWGAVVFSGEQTAF